MSNIVELIDKAEQRFHAVAPRNMKFEAEKGFAVQLLNNNPKLGVIALNNPASLLQAITNIAATGLTLNPAEKQAYLLTRSVKIADKVWEDRIFLEPSYVGLIRLATDSESILWVQSRVVRESDQFMDNGPGNAPTHTYNAFGDRGDIVGVYCVAKTKHGDFLTEIMTKDQVDDIKGRSESGKRGFGPWISDYEEMARKTVVRKAFKTWPRTISSERMALAVDLSNINEGFEPIVSAPEIERPTADQKAYFDQLIEQDDAVGMAVFSASIASGTYTSLYHSFPKGEKGKYQRVVDALVAKGNSLLQDWAQGITDDQSLILDMLSELSDEAVEMVKARVDDAIAIEITQAQRNASD